MPGSASIGIIFTYLILIISKPTNHVDVMWVDAPQYEAGYCSSLVTDLKTLDRVVEAQCFNMGEGFVKQDFTKWQPGQIVFVYFQNGYPPQPDE